MTFTEWAWFEQKKIEQKEKLEKFKMDEFARFDGYKKENGKGLDNIIFVLSTGLFVLSINYLTGLKDLFLIKPSLIIYAWCALGVAILAHAAAYYYGEKNADAAIDSINEWAESNFTIKLDLGTNKNFNRSNTILKQMNFVSWFFVFIAIVLMIIFGSINLLYRNEINKVIEYQKYHPTSQDSIETKKIDVQGKVMGSK